MLAERGAWHDVRAASVYFPWGAFKFMCVKHIRYLNGCPGGPTKQGTKMADEEDRKYAVTNFRAARSRLATAIYAVGWAAERDPSAAKAGNLAKLRCALEILDSVDHEDPKFKKRKGT